MPCNDIFRIPSTTPVPSRATAAQNGDALGMIVEVGPLWPSEGPPPPATGTETDAVRARAGPAYLDKMQISSLLPLPPLAGPFQNPGQIRGAAPGFRTCRA